jgi:Putative zinc-finger
VLDHLATKALRRQPRVLSEACLDAELVAAYLDGGMSTKEAADVEQHLSQCGRCRALAAALVKTSGGAEMPDALADVRAVTTAATRGLLASRAARMWLPVAAALTVGVALWMTVPRRPAVLPAPVRYSTVPQSGAPQGSTNTQRGAEVLSEPPSVRSDRRDAEVSKKVETRKKSVVQNEADEMMRTARRAPAELTSRSLQTAPPAARATEEPAQAAEARKKLEDSLSSEARRRVQEQRVAYKAPVPAEAPRAQPAGVVAGSVGARQQDKAQAASPTDALLRSRPPLLFSAPDEVVQWRILDRQRIERSVDGGKTWVRHFEASAPRLFAGSAPAADCAWVVGAEGLVMRWKPDVSWQAVLGKPTDDDLYIVDAKNEHEATVVSVSGSAYATTDGGATWKLQP